MSGLEEEPGAEFLARRLARAAAIPPEQRSQDVAIFLESEELLSEARQALPLDSHGRPALSAAAAASPAVRYRLLLAMAKVARSDWLCFMESPTMVLTVRHVAAYQECVNAAEALVPRRSRPRSAQESLFAALHLPLTFALAGIKTMGRMRKAMAIADGLADPTLGANLRQALQQLRRSSGGPCRGEQQAPLLTLEQLRCLLALRVMDWGKRARRPQLPEAEREEVAHAAARSMRLILELEPSSPHSHTVAAAGSIGGAAKLRMLTHYLEAFRLARQPHARDNLFTVFGAACAV